MTFRDLKIPCYGGGLAFLLTLGCLAIAQGCDHCLFGSLYCHKDVQQCMYGCEPGWKGPACSDRCEIFDCKACVIDVDGNEKCTSCVEGFYGPKCKTRCSANCVRPSDSDVCDQYGHCHYGCKKPFKGARCEEQDCPYANCQWCKSGFHNIYCDKCVQGYYWKNEQLKCIPCSEHCLNGSSACDPHSGFCNSGRCKDRWFGNRCEHFCDVVNCTRCSLNNNQITCQECQTGHYPSSAGRQCTSCAEKHCQGTCDPQTGQCKSGCQPRYYGSGYKCNMICDIQNCAQCTISYQNRPSCAKCKEGFYADRVGVCKKCLASCKNGKCDAYSGSCTDGCYEGYHGTKCQYRCGEHCVNKTCQARTGQCTCEEGWYGDRCDRDCPVHCRSCDKFQNGVCDECEAGYWGKVCDIRCNSNCRHSGYGNYLYCDKITGECPNGCYTGFYGDACNASCSWNCESKACDMKTGECSVGCSMGWYGKKCDHQCPANCKDAVVGWSRTCNQTDGQCKHGCKAGFYGQYCNRTCSYRCKNRQCYDTGECVYGCAEGFTGPGCTYICTGDCPSECSPNCLEESCDEESKVCMDGCIRGWYGINCQEICSNNCRDRLCHQFQGTCLGPCNRGYYGPNCASVCSPNCLERNCNQQTGYCTFGCKADFHGPNCSQSCSSNCPNGTCDRDTGACSYCSIGRRGALCDQDCLPGTYGMNCQERCGHCKDYSPCYTVDGRCPSACEAGWTGPACNQALAQYSQEHDTSLSVGVQIAIGCTVGGVFCLLIVIPIVFYIRKKSWKKQKSEPAVMYSDAQVNIESVHQPCTSVQIVQAPGDNGSQASTVSIQSQSAMLLGDPDTSSQIKVLQVLDKGEFYTLHKGMVNIRNQQEECCVKYVQLTDLDDGGLYLKRLMKESDILTTCGSHINIINLVKTYLNTDVYCIAMNKSMQTGLLPHLQRLQTGTEDWNISSADAFQILQFAVDCCTAVCHLHGLKILHRTLRARHVYLSDTLVAKLGNFEWADTVAVETDEASEEAVQMEALPVEFYSWLAPESFLKNDYSFSSDVWSLGLLFWEIFTLGRAPFEGLDPDTHQQAVMDGIRPSKPNLAHFTLYRVMKSCWRYDTEDRPTADNLLQQLIDIQGRYSEVENIVVHV